MADWRTSVSMDKFEQLRKMYKDAGVTIYAWKPSTFSAQNTDAEIDYAFRAAKALGASHCTVELPTDPAQSLRLGKLAEKNKLFIAYHTHAQGSITAFDTAFSQSEFNKSNIDIGHYVTVPTNGSPIEFLKKYNDKIASIHIKDRTGRIQAYIRKDKVGEEQFKIFKLMDIGDHIGLKGTFFRTKTGELTILANQIALLSKSLRPLPEKLHYFCSRPCQKSQQLFLRIPPPALHHKKQA